MDKFGGTTIQYRGFDIEVTHKGGSIYVAQVHVPPHERMEFEDEEGDVVDRAKAYVDQHRDDAVGGS